MTVRPPPSSGRWRGHLLPVGEGLQCRVPCVGGRGIRHGLLYASLRAKPWHPKQNHFDERCTVRPVAQMTNVERERAGVRGVENNTGFEDDGSTTPSSGRWRGHLLPVGEGLQCRVPCVGGRGIRHGLLYASLRAKPWHPKQNHFDERCTVRPVAQMTNVERERAGVRGVENNTGFEDDGSTTPSSGRWRGHLLPVGEGLQCDAWLR